MKDRNDDLDMLADRARELALEIATNPSPSPETCALYAQACELLTRHGIDPTTAPCTPR